MALADLRIKEWINVGKVFIHPYEEENVGSASVDVRLGRWFFQAEKARSPHRGFYNIYSEKSTKHVWGEAQEAVPAWQFKRAHAEDWENIADDDLVIMLMPHANLLCHTHEFIGARIEATTMMKARSSIGRSLVNVCQCAGMGDVGYFNRWTMEIYNRSDWYIPLVVGRRVAQIVFLETGPSEKVYISKYQGTDDLNKLVRSWSPYDMLPRLHWDRDIGYKYIEVV